MDRSFGIPSDAAVTNLLEIGRTGRAHGLRGEVTVTLTTNVDDRLAPGLELVVGDVPRTIATVRPHQDRWLVGFDGIIDRTAAEGIAHQKIYGEPVDDPDALWVHELIGSAVVGVDGRDHGTVEAVIDNPASDLLELGSGALVPLTFVVSSADGRIVIDPPAGLLDADPDDDEPDDGDPDDDEPDDDAPGDDDDD